MIDATRCKRARHSDRLSRMPTGSLVQDLRYTLRILRRDSGFAIFAVAIAGLGIGASATVFSVLNTLLLRPLPFTNPERLLWVPNQDPPRLVRETPPGGGMG